MGIIVDKISSLTPYRPNDAYDLNRALGIGATSTILTYIIILTQFKLSEGGTQQQTNNATISIEN